MALFTPRHNVIWYMHFFSYSAIYLYTSYKLLRIILLDDDVTKKELMTNTQERLILLCSDISAMGVSATEVSASTAYI